MNIDTWFKPTQFVSETGYSFREADILDAKRFIYLFFDQEDLDNHRTGNIINGNSIIGKAIQINLSISKGGKGNIDIVPWIRGTDNSTYMTIAMYVYDTLFDTNITNIHEAQFTLINSMISSTTNDYDIKKAMINGVNVYSKDIRDKTDKKNLLSTMLQQSAPNIPEPMYYTMKQQEYEEHDCYCLTGLTHSITHYGRDLLDDETRISVMNSSVIHTMEPVMRDKLFQIRNSIKVSDYTLNMYDTTDLSNNLIYQDFESMQSGYTYIYDTNMGFNILKSAKAFTPFMKYQFEDKIVNDLQRTSEIIKQHAAGVEKQFGPVRLMFTPIYFGDKMDIMFKDYKPDNQPVALNKTEIDNGTKLQQEISDMLYDIENDQYFNEYEIQ